MSPFRINRGSFVWAVILILIGAAFLLANLNIAVHPWQLLAQYWPALIVLWGLVRLFDYVQARRHPEVPAPRFSGSDVLLLLLFLILGTIFSRLVRAPWNQWRTEWGIHLGPDAWDNPFLHSYTFTRNVSEVLPPGAALALADRRGDVAIQGAKIKDIEGNVQETIRASSEADAKKIDQQVHIQLTDEAGRYVLRPGPEGWNAGRDDVRLDWTLRVPQATAADISTAHGAVQLTGLAGDQKIAVRSGDARVSAIHGDVEVQGAGSSADVHDIDGNVRVSSRGGALRAEAVSGKVSVDGFIDAIHLSNIKQGVEISGHRTTLAVAQLDGRLDMDRGSIALAGAGGPLEINTRQKDVRVADFTRGVKISDRDANIRLSAAAPPRETIDVQLVNGDIVLALPPQAQFSLQAVSRHGAVSSEFTAPGLEIQQHGNAPSMKGVMGDGGPLIRLTTTYGTIRLVRETPGKAVPASSGHGIEARRSSGFQPALRPRVLTPPAFLW